jgi:tRNA pseudouridine55 synthase
MAQKVATQGGLVVVDKPGGMTSHDVVSRMRRLAKTRRVGHGGTLDPMATGVLIIGVEKATRLLTYVIGSTKEYRATIRLGQATITDDAEGTVVSTVDASAITDGDLATGLAPLRGEIQQVPSAVSAIKINGVRSYHRVRSGEEVELNARPVTVSRLDLLAVRREGEVVDLDVDVACSSGTYIRALARDLGVTLGVGGHLTALRRTAVGAFTLAEAATLDDLAGLPELFGREDPVTMPLPAAADRCFPRRDASEDEAKTLSHGGPLSPIGIAGPYAVFASDGTVLAIVREKDGKARPEIVLVP